MPIKNSSCITFHVDGLALSGVLHQPESKAWAIIIGCHGLMADKNSPKQIDLANRCTSAGLAYFRFDHRGCGESEGNFQTDTTLEGRMADLIAAVKKMKKLFPNPNLPIGLFGSSLGGTVCLTAAGRIAPFSIVTLAAPVKSQSIELPKDSPQSLINEVNQNRLQFNIHSRLSTIHHILIIHGSADQTVNVQNAYIINQTVKEPKKLLIIENGDHRITDKTHQEQYAQETVRWYRTCAKPFKGTDSRHALKKAPRNQGAH